MANAEAGDRPETSAESGGSIPERDGGLLSENFLKHIRAAMGQRRNWVLIVDDYPAMRRSIARNIRNCDTTVMVFEAGNGEEALVMLRELREEVERDPLFIITDLEMPVMDGWTLIRELRTDYQERGLSQGVPVIVLSSTDGTKGLPLVGKSVHGRRTGYSPLVTVAKETCLDASRYDGQGEKGLLDWVAHFLRYAW